MCDQYIGEIRMFAGSYAPVEWAFCNGQLLQIAEYNALFALLGQRYGGDGVTNFALPDLRGRIPMGKGQGPGLANYNMASTGGTETVGLSVSQMPQHTHSISATSTNGNLSTPSEDIWAQSTSRIYSAVAVTATLTDQMSPNALSSVGGGLQHNNMMPYFPISFIIATNGIFPSQQ